MDKKQPKKPSAEVQALIESLMQSPCAPVEVHVWEFKMGPADNQVGDGETGGGVQQVTSEEEVPPDFNPVLKGILEHLNQMFRPLTFEDMADPDHIPPGVQHFEPTIIEPEERLRRLNRRVDG